MNYPSTSQYPLINIYGGIFERIFIYNLVLKFWHYNYLRIPIKGIQMSLQTKIMEAMKVAMKDKDTLALQALRSVKSAILLAQTETGAKAEISEEEEMKILQKLVKQRKDSAAIYQEQGRTDLADPELTEASIIEQFLPAPLDEAKVAAIIDEVIAQLGATSMADMGKVMGLANQKMVGRADGKTISGIVKNKLS